MNKLVYAVLAVVVGGCAVESSGDHTVSSDSELRIINGAFTFKLPGTFDLGNKPVSFPARMPKSVCDPHEQLTLVNAPYATAKLGPANAATPGSPAVCGTVAVAPEEFELNFARVEDSGAKVFRGVSKTPPVTDVDGHPIGGRRTIEIIDRREQWLPVAFPAPVRVEVTIGGGLGLVQKLYNRQEALPNEIACNTAASETACKAQVGCAGKYVQPVFGEGAEGTTNPHWGPVYVGCEDKNCAELPEGVCGAVSHCSEGWVSLPVEPSPPPVFQCRNNMVRNDGE